MRNYLLFGCFGFASLRIIRVSKYKNKSDRKLDFCTHKSFAKAKQKYSQNNSTISNFIQIFKTVGRMHCLSGQPFSFADGQNMTDFDHSFDTNFDR